MASLKALRTRIASVTATRKITKAQQMVAVSKLRRAQAANEAARPYAQKMKAVISGMAAGLKNNPGGPKLLTGNGKDDKHLLVVCTADRGLCGGFNSNIVRFAKVKIEELKAEGKKVEILCVGRKGRDQLKRQYAELIVDTVEFTAVRQLGFANADEIGKKLLAWFEEGKFDVATLIYARFRSVMTQTPTALRLIPAAIEETDSKTGQVYEYEPDEAEVLAELLPKNISVQIFSALLENVAGEFGAKMTAMDGATRNAGEMINKLTLLYNRTRQGKITSELIEIISGAEAL
ncbi:F0F1 ATP synthase subunit gamma [Rhizomicrobium electricum]|uniref:ATP synthase gamma chain n=1 Tax=Rhizomicrobium electricum TaxID=480070 RepID=A0ABN1DZ05_9PROT|nr:F0F1 ATP synthase subunit gamma [Rhizomicrobium electricum]NIJ47239.1 F-type H+-transporting ATPase subunit gamma [Rhizomicrobium electricum]